MLIVLFISCLNIAGANKEINIGVVPSYPVPMEILGGVHTLQLDDFVINDTVKILFDEDIENIIKLKEGETFTIVSNTSLDKDLEITIIKIKNPKLVLVKLVEVDSLGVLDSSVSDAALTGVEVGSTEDIEIVVTDSEGNELPLEKEVIPIIPDGQDIESEIKGEVTAEFVVEEDSKTGLAKFVLFIIAFVLFIIGYKLYYKKKEEDPEDASLEEKD